MVLVGVGAPVSEAVHTVKIRFCWTAGTRECGDIQARSSVA